VFATLIEILPIYYISMSESPSTRNGSPSPSSTSCGRSWNFGHCRNTVLPRNFAMNVLRGLQASKREVII